MKSLYRVDENFEKKKLTTFNDFQRLSTTSTTFKMTLALKRLFINNLFFFRFIVDLVDKYLLEKLKIYICKILFLYINMKKSKKVEIVEMKSRNKKSKKSI